MIVGTATEALTGMRHRAVQLTLEVKFKGYSVSVEETCTKLDGINVRHLEVPKVAREEFSTLDALYEKAYAVFDGVDTLGETEGISQDLVGEAIRSVADQIDDILLGNGAAHLEDSGTLVVDWDEDACRELISNCDDD